jgi:hypothetical protein
LVFTTIELFENIRETPAEKKIQLKKMLNGTDMRDSCGSSGIGETLAGLPRWLTARPTKKRASWSANQLTSSLDSNKVYENSLFNIYLHF